MLILGIITDQLRNDTLHSDFCKTPNLDAFANLATVFKCCYAQSPQCHPSRVSLMTGRYPTAHRSWTNSDTIGANERPISKVLNENDYECVYFGKAHLAGDFADDRDIMADLGYDYWFTYKDWADLCKTLDKEDNPLVEFTGIMKSKNWVGKLTNKKLHHDEVITTKAIDYISGCDRDAFVTVSYYGPHPPYASPEPFYSMYNLEDMPSPWELGGRTLRDWQEIKAQYYGSISWIDENIGRLLSVVPEDAIVFFTSDHGDILGDHGHFSKGIFGYEGNTRVPLMIKSNLGIGSVDDIVQHIDVVPTILELVGIDSKTQGKSLICGPSNDFALSMIGDNPKLKILRYKNYKYWVGKDIEVAFDLESDPNERECINDPDILGFLRRKMIDALIASED